MANSCRRLSLLLLLGALVIVSTITTAFVDDVATSIIHMDSAAMPTAFSDCQSYHATLAAAVSRSSTVGDRILYVYEHAVHGFSPRLKRSRGFLACHVDAWGLLANNPNLTLLDPTPRDDDSHGTHTSSTAGGSRSDEAAFFGYDPGEATGMAPCAHLAVYKAMWSSFAGSSSSDIIVAVDKAIINGVDVLSLSLRFDDLALIVDRTFAATVTLGDDTIVLGQSLYPGCSAFINRQLPLVFLDQCDNTTLLENNRHNIMISSAAVGKISTVVGKISAVIELSSNEFSSIETADVGFLSESSSKRA
ncbi:hypothetical protein ZIOFF_041254 [Zingiber officinale]|uniref:Membrane-associated protein n=1 Tax=Zingiber officinale TaxID=94328 RepID=A0A8J5G6C1_ZINOF|nr:hypothetical protein ZIOFF_041254 [Zingiber officinale]